MTGNTGKGASRTGRYGADEAAKSKAAAKAIATEYQANRAPVNQRIAKLKRAYIKACSVGGSTKHYLAVTTWLKREIDRYTLCQKPRCWVCTDVLMVGVSDSKGKKVHVHCKRLAEMGYAAVRDVANTPPVGMYISKRPAQLTSYDWEVKGDAEDNGPAHIGPEM